MRWKSFSLAKKGNNFYQDKSLVLHFKPVKSFKFPHMTLSVLKTTWNRGGDSDQEWGIPFRDDS